MNTTINKQILQWIPLLEIGVLSLGTLLSFIISYINGNVSLYLPFISETGAYTPAKSIFSFSLIIGSFMGCLLFFFVYVEMSAVSGMLISYHLDFFSCIVGIISMIGLAGVAAFPMTTVFWAHLVFASTYFVGSALYFSMITFITWKCNGRKYILRIRFILCCAITIFLLLITICFPISLKYWHDVHDIIPALKEPHHKGFTLLVISSALEWSIVLVIILFTATFIIDTEKKPILLVINTEECEKDPPVEDPPGDTETIS